MKEILDMLKNAVILLLILWIGFTFFIGVKMAPNDDMKPRISVGDILLYYRLDHNPAVNSVAVINKNDTDYVGRIIAKEGDTVEITKESALLINGNMAVENMIYYSTPYYEGYTEYPITLNKDEFFILVDKREGGEDSRYYGPVTKKEIKGTVFGLYRRNSL